LPIQVQEASRTPNRLDQNTTSPRILSLKWQPQRTEKECWRLREKTNNI
jgi:hypothetical protein